MYVQAKGQVLTAVARYHGQRIDYEDARRIYMLYTYMSVCVQLAGLTAFFKWPVAIFFRGIAQLEFFGKFANERYSLSVSVSAGVLCVRYGNFPKCSVAFFSRARVILAGLAGSERRMYFWEENHRYIYTQSECAKVAVLYSRVLFDKITRRRILRGVQCDVIR